MPTLHPYLNFNGNTEEAFLFYKSVFGGDFRMVQRFSEVPGTENVPDHEKDKIMHIALPIGNHTILMGTDTLESMKQNATSGTNISLSVDAASLEEAEQVFNGLAAGGQVSMPLEKTFWNAYFGMLTDKFGIQWMVNYDLKES